MEKQASEQFEAAVISVPMDFGGQRMTAEMIKRHIMNNPDKRILVLSESVIKLRHLKHEASEAGLDIQLKGSTKDISQKERVVALPINKLYGVRRCKSTRFDLVIVIDIEGGSIHLNRYLEKCPASKSIWMVGVEKRVELIDRVNYLSNKVKEKLVSFFEYNEDVGLTHSLCTVTGDMSKKSISYLSVQT